MNNYDKHPDCPECNGNGKDKDLKLSCGLCGGSGWKIIYQQSARMLLEAAKRVGASWHQPSRQVPDSIKSELFDAIIACGGRAGRDD